jgi:zinc protease
MTRMYEDYFVPNNALLALVGDITEDRARTLAEQYFGRLPRAGPPPERLNVEAQPVPGGTVRLDWQEPLSPRVIVRHRIPAVGHADRPAFDAVAAVLRSNLAQSLSGAGLNASASVSASRSGSPSTITIDVSARHDADLAGIETTILNEVERLKHEPVAAHTLEGVQRALRFNWEQTRTDRGGLAAALGSFEVMDSWKTLQAFMEARERASPADIQRLASRYLVSSNRIVGTSRRNPEPPTSGARALTDGGAP